jgi:triacylglycerol lipase
MLATYLRLLLVFEIALYAGLATGFFDASPAIAALAALAGVLLLRGLITALIYFWAWIYRSPAAPLPVLQAIRMVLAEYAAFIANFVLLSPFEYWWMGPERLRPATDRPPLLLVHGYGCSRAAWWWLRRRLEAAGWTVATISLEPIYTSIDNYVEPLAQRIDEVLAETGAPQLILIGHSMGGLLARAYLRRYGAQRVARLITLATPHAGSRLAALGMGQNGRQMEPGSPWLTALALETALPETIVIYSSHDNYVIPQSNLLWPGAINRPLDGLGHLGMLYSPRVATALLAALAGRNTPDAGEC